MGHVPMTEKSGLYIRQGQDIYLFSTTSRPALGPNQPPGAVSLEVKGGGGVKLTSHFHLVPRLRNVELYLHSPKRLHDVVLN
jgi:hypothetical protein